MGCRLKPENVKWKLNNYNRSKPEILRFLRDIIVFRLVSYLWSVWSTNFIQNCMYMNFLINLTQLYINFSRQKHQIDVLINALRFSGFSLYPLSFFLTKSDLRISSLKEITDKFNTFTLFSQIRGRI